LNKLENHGGYDWETYIKTRKLWITETNCNGDPDAIDDFGIASQE